MFRPYGLAAACAMLALTAPSTALAAPGDSVTGGGISAVDTRFGFNAHSNAAGGDAGGYAVFKTVNGTSAARKGEVTCLRVSGNTAVIGIQDYTADGTLVYRQFFIRDNGDPVGGVAVDELREIGSGSPTPLPCADPAEQGGGLILQEGNIVIRNA